MPDYKSLINARVQRAGEQMDLRALQRQAAQNETVEWDTTKWIAVDRITVDERIQVRVGGLDLATVERYATMMAEAGRFEPFPPVVLFRDPEDDTLWLSAGFHRVAAVVEADRIRIQDEEPPIGGVLAEIRPGGFEEAYWYAITDNLKNGLQMGAADQKEALRRLLGYDLPGGESKNYVSLSNRQLAGIIGVTHRTIGKWREELKAEAQTTGYQYPVDTKRVGADGRVYDVGNIQAANEQRAQQKPPRTPSPRRVDQHDGYDFNQDSGYEEGALDYGEPETWRDVRQHQPDLASSDGESAAQHVNVALVALLNAVLETAAAIETMDAGQDHFTADELRDIETSATEVLQYLQGYRSRQGRRVAGLLDLLDGLRRFVRGGLE